MNINFSIEKLDELSLYSNDELNIIAKQLFVEWFTRKYKHSDISDQLIQHQNKIRLDFQENFSNIKNELEHLSKTTKDVFGLSKTSQKRGEIMENKVIEYFEQTYKNYTINRTNHIPHNGDAEVILSDETKILLEIKNYTTTVDTKEIEKLKYDMEFCNVKYSLFLSIQSGIVGKKNIDIERFFINDLDHYIVYISNISDEYNKIQAGISIIETLIKINKMTKNINTDYIEEKLKNSIKEISYIYDIISSLTKQYKNMESRIKDNLDDYYNLIREQELNIKNKINEIWKNIDITDLLEYHELDTMILDDKDHECNNILLKISDIFNKYKIKVISKSDTLFLMSNNGELKLFNKKIEISFDNPRIVIRFISKTNNDINYNLLIGILNLIKIRNI